MRITKVMIDRFGRITNRTLDISPGLTVLHGPNESGKTTTMEFIRSALVPTSQRNVYPKRARTDSGRVIVDDDGIERMIVLEGRSRKGDIPECIIDLDQHMFRSIFAMTSADLDSDEIISSGDIRTRFLTLPGGDSIPSMIADSVKDADSVLGRTTRSSSVLSSIENDLRVTEERISVLRDQVDRYGDLVRERDSLMSRLDCIRGNVSAIGSGRVTAALYESNAINFTNLGEMESRLQGLEDLQVADKDDVERYNSLRSASQSATKEFSDCFHSCEMFLTSMNGTDPETVLRYADMIEQLPFQIHQYRRDSMEVGVRRTSSPVVRRGINPMMVAGGVLTAAGIVASVLYPLSLLMVPVGIAVSFLGYRSWKAAGRMSADVDDVDTAMLARSVSEFEGRVSSFLECFHMGSEGMESDVIRLTSLVRDARRYSECSERCLSLRLKATEESGKLNSFLQFYGGKEGFEEAVRRYEEVVSLRSSVDALRTALRSAGLDPDVRSCPTDVEDDGLADATEIGMEIGRIESEMASIMDCDELNQLLDRRQALVSRKERALVEGAEAMLRRKVCEMACDSAYSESGRGVVSTADRYLSMMTGGRYRMDNDPRETSISVKGDDGPRTLEQCSTGLRAQVLLSLKLAVAKEMGGGKVPVILDDVLLPFDTERKCGAIRALEEISREMQVIVFTCDDAVASMCREGGLIRL